MIRETLPKADPFRKISDTERETFEDQGVLFVRNALDSAQTKHFENAVDEVYAEQARLARCKKDGQMHALGAISLHAAFIDLLDLSTTFPYIWGHLGWNIYMHHSHIDVDPPVREPAAPVWMWHQDGYRQNLDLGESPRPRLSIKVAYVLSDLSEPGRGGTLFIPRSHLTKTLDRTAHGPDGEFVRPPGTVEVVGNPGDAFIFDRRIWHSRSLNRSAVTRKMVFLCYTYRWIRPRDAAFADRADPAWEKLSPLRRQLLGDGDHLDSYFGLAPNSGAWDERIPLRAELDARGVLDRSQPYLR